MQYLNLPTYFYLEFFFFNTVCYKRSHVGNRIIHSVECATYIIRIKGCVNALEVEFKLYNNILCGYIYYNFL